MLRQYLSNRLSTRLVCAWRYKVVGAVVSLLSSLLSSPSFFLFLFFFHSIFPGTSVIVTWYPFKRALNGGGVGLVLLLLFSPSSSHFSISVSLQRFTNEDHLAVHKHKHEMTLKFGPARTDSVIIAGICCPKVIRFAVSRQLRLIPGSKCLRSCTPFLLSRPLLWSAFNQE